MKHKLILLFFLLLPALGFCQQENGEVKKVAILEVVDKKGNIDYPIKLMLRSKLTAAVTNTPGYEGYDRVDISEIIGEQKFQRTGMVSDAQIKKLGEMTGAAYILVAEAVKWDMNHLFITAKILEVESAGVKQTADARSATTAEEFEEACRQLALKLFNFQEESINDQTFFTPLNSDMSYRVLSNNTDTSDLFFEFLHKNEEEWKNLCYIINMGDGYSLAIKKENFREQNYLEWDKTVKKCSGYRGGNFTDWRLPTEKELQIIFANMDFPDYWFWTLEKKVIDPNGNYHNRKNYNKRCDKFRYFTVRKFKTEKKIISLNMVYVSGGTFKAGKNAKAKRNANYDIKLSPYYIGRYEVTQALWEFVMDSNPSHYKGSDYPVDSVSWNDIQIFISKLNALTGRRFSLPTEAQWEFAAKGGENSRHYKYSGGKNIKQVAWCKTDSKNTPHPVGQKVANELGLYDMSGNVWEWCSDSYNSDCSGRVRRGGSWNNKARLCRVSHRISNDSEYRNKSIGFRLVLLP